VTTDTNFTDEDQDILVCEFAKRPKGAPSFDDLRAAVRQVRREAGVLAIEYDPAVATAVEQLAAAERLCCPTVGFEVTHTPVPTLRIRATPVQLEIFEQFLTS
jgi:hypothetical protein